VQGKSNVVCRVSQMCVQGKSNVCAG
jgi:hypothetical protein